MEERLKLFFAQLFLLISSVSTEQSQICVKNTKLSMWERRDPYWQDNLTHCLCWQVRWWKHLHLRPMILRKKIYCKDTKNEWKGHHNKIVWLRFVLTQDSWQQLESDSTSWQRTLKNFSQFKESVACRKMEWKSELNESVNKDNSHSWVRISRGMNKLVTDLSNNDNNEQETSEILFEDYSLQSNARAFACRSKAKAKPRRRTSTCSSTRTIPIWERSWTDIEPETCSPIAYSVSKQLSTLLRHGHLPREVDGAIEFWRSKDYLRNELGILSTLVWWNVEE